MWEIPAGATAIFVGSNRLGAWADEQLEPELKARLTNYLKSAQWISDLDIVFLSLQRPLNIIFGPNYLSAKALKRSAQVTLAITLPFVLYYYFFVWVPNYWVDVSTLVGHFGDFLHETVYYVWRNAPRMVVAMLLDFLSVLRVRFLIGRLSRPTPSLLQSIALLTLEFLAALFIFYLVWETYGAFENLRSFYDLSSMLQWELDNQNLARIIVTFRTAVLMSSLTSVYFYGGLAPSIWLLLFVMSVILLKLSHVLSPLLQTFTHSIRFEKPLLFTGNLIGILLAGFYIAAMWL